MSGPFDGLLEAAAIPAALPADAAPSSMLEIAALSQAISIKRIADHLCQRPTDAELYRLLAAVGDPHDYGEFSNATETGLEARRLARIMRGGRE